MSTAEMTREERDALIVELRGQGLSLSEVGSRVGLSGTRVSRILNGVGTPLNPEGMSPRATPTATIRHCATPGCGAELVGDHRIHSDHTNLDYCYVGEGCWLWSEEERREKRLASVEASATKVEETEDEPEYGWAVMGKSGPLGRWLTREGAEELQRVSGGKLVPMEEVL